MRCMTAVINFARSCHASSILRDCEALISEGRDRMQKRNIEIRDIIPLMLKHPSLDLRQNITRKILQSSPIFKMLNFKCNVSLMLMTLFCHMSKNNRGDVKTVIRRSSRRLYSALQLYGIVYTYFLGVAFDDMLANVLWRGRPSPPRHHLPHKGGPDLPFPCALLLP